MSDDKNRAGDEIDFETFMQGLLKSISGDGDPIIPTSGMASVDPETGKISDVESLPSSAKEALDKIIEYTQAEALKNEIIVQSAWAVVHAQICEECGETFKEALAVATAEADKENISRTPLNLSI